jgi:hypothetical protein
LPCGKPNRTVSLKAELELRHLHEKPDYPLSQQWTRLLEIQSFS